MRADSEVVLYLASTISCDRQGHTLVTQQVEARRESSHRGQFSITVNALHGLTTALMGDTVLQPSHTTCLLLLKTNLNF